MAERPVCMLSFDFPPLEGGISRLCAAIVDELVSQGRAVSVVSREVEAGKQAFASPKTPEFRVSSKRGKAEWQLFRQLRRQHRDDLIITGVWYPEALIARLAGCRHIAVLAHGNDVMLGKPSFKNRLLTWVRKRIFASVDLIIANSHYTADIVRQQTSTPVKVETLGVDANRFTPITAEATAAVRESFGLPNDKFLMLTTSRVQAYKGHDVVLNAIASLADNVKSNVHYAIAGRGEHLSELQAIAARLGLSQQVTFLGFVEEADLAKLYGCVDAFVMCTREEKAAKQVEGFGLVFLEAQASGTVAIGTRQGGIVDAIADENGGYLIERDDSTALATLITTLQSDSSLCETQGKKARARVEAEATWQHYGQRVTALLNEFFGGKHE